MKQVKELSTVGYMFSTTDDSDDLVHGNYAVGFASSDFIIWNLTAEAKVVQIACGGWRRPHSFYLGDLPEIKNCFAFVKDEVIYIHRKWVDVQERNIYPRNLHLQFHGREIHSLCFVPEDSNWNVNGKQDGSKSCCVATGCEDGTVRLTRFESGIENWSASKLLGEHVGGSAVRSICFVSKMHKVELDPTYMPHVTCRNEETGESEVGPFLLMSVGAKKVVTCWKCKTREKSEREDGLHIKQNSKDEIANYSSSSARSLSSMSFQWLTTDMPTKSSNHDSKHVKKHMVESVDEITSSSGKAKSNGSPHVERKLDLQQHHVDKHENDWRYLDVASFLVNVINVRVSVCFIVIACSDATLTLRALILPHRLWFDVAVLAPLSSPVLALQHVAIPKHLPSEGSIKNQSLHIVLSGATDGSITFWDLTAEVENFVQRVPSILMENNMDHQKRPRTGRGSQGGRWWRSLGGPALKKHPIHNHNGQSDSMENLDNNSISERIAEKSNHGILDVKCEIPYSKEEKLDICQDICEIGPLHVLNNVHQSGVNCLHVSNLKETGVSGSEFLYSIISGGDDQAVNCLTINLSLEAIAGQENCSTAIGINSCMEHCRIQDYWMTLTSLDKNYSAHSSAVKGVWTDGRWVFSTGLDQRLRCWVLAENGKLIEHSNLVISVPEPESLDARICSRNYYQIAISGRGLQMVDFFASGNNRSGN
ncbi:hypothetical protein Leryth_008997 [Lithospermum erythrorhizon]|nr:hypothetical protein Leryth_008997 [Lithospermum erythrorhizon]